MRMSIIGNFVMCNLLFLHFSSSASCTVVVVYRLCVICFYTSLAKIVLHPVYTVAVVEQCAKFCALHRITSHVFYACRV